MDSGVMKVLNSRQRRRSDQSQSENSRSSPRTRQKSKPTASYEACFGKIFQKKVDSSRLDTR